MKLYKTSTEQGLPQNSKFYSKYTTHQTNKI